MIDSAGATVSRAVMTVAYVEKGTTRAAEWPADVVALFFEAETASTPTPG
jgi:acyl-CoA thioester hydrolase